MINKEKQTKRGKIMIEEGKREALRGKKLLSCWLISLACLYFFPLENVYVFKSDTHLFKRRARSAGYAASVRATRLLLGYEHDTLPAHRFSITNALYATLSCVTEAPSPRNERAFFAFRVYSYVNLEMRRGRARQINLAPYYMYVCKCACTY